MAMLICCNCGKKVWDQGTYCLHCGTPVEETLRRLREKNAEQEVTSAKEETPKHEEPVVHEEPVIVEKPVVQEQPAAQETKEEPAKSQSTEIDTDIDSDDYQRPINTVKHGIILVFMVVIILVDMCDTSSDNDNDNDGHIASFDVEATEDTSAIDSTISKHFAVNDITEPTDQWPSDNDESAYQWQLRQVSLDYDIKRQYCQVLSSVKWLFIENQRQPFLTIIMPVERDETANDGALRFKPTPTDVILAFTDKSVTYLHDDEVYETPIFSLARHIKRTGSDMIVTVTNEDGSKQKYKLLPYGKSNRLVKFADPMRIYKQMHTTGKYTVEIPYQLSQNNITTLEFPMDVHGRDAQLHSCNYSGQ